MPSLTLELDALPTLRAATAATDIDIPAAATLAELAGVDAVRLGVNVDLKPVREEDLKDVRRAARRLELRMQPVEGLLKVALQTRPERVLLAADGRDGRAATARLDLRGRSAALGPIVRALDEAGIAVAVLVSPNLEAVKAAHALGVGGVEFFTGALVDLPAAQRRDELRRLSDAVRLAAKLRLGIGLGGGLGYRSLREVMSEAPAAEWVAVGRSALSRAVLVGLDRALRDLQALLQ